LAATFGLSRRTLEDELMDVQARGHSHTAQQSSSVTEKWRNISGQTSDYKVQKCFPYLGQQAPLPFLCTTILYCNHYELVITYVMRSLFLPK